MKRSAFVVAVVVAVCWLDKSIRRFGSENNVDNFLWFILLINHSSKGHSPCKTHFTTFTIQQKYEKQNQFIRKIKRRAFCAPYILFLHNRIHTHIHTNTEQSRSSHTKKHDYFIMWRTIFHSSFASRGG